MYQTFTLSLVAKIKETLFQFTEMQKNYDIIKYFTI